MEEKIDELFDAMRADAVLLRTNELHIDPNFYYFAGISRLKQLSSFLVLRRGKKPLVITSPLEYGVLRQQKQISVVCYASEQQLAAQLRKALRGTVGLNYAAYPLGAYRRLKKLLSRKSFVDVSKELEKVRETKTTAEIRKLAGACAITEEILAGVPGMYRSGMTEEQLAFELNMRAMRDAEGISFPTIVAAGSNAAVPHHITGNRKIGRGVLLVDFGVINDGYCSDVTRCFAIGKPTEREMHVYNVVHRSQQAALALVRDGVAARDVFRAANAILVKELKQSMLHSLGHGLGVLVHDVPHGLGESSAFTLRKDMCITAEPGYYKEFGVRIEDDVVVTKRGCRALSKAPKELTRL
ncbi:MAG: aminopeptidase P family protein [Candidatus Aenigmarchaeota archaeon]|nr:aminopeptidase P family protein [Candidatus Aenigmarchaeota archaeon]